MGVVKTHGEREEVAGKAREGVGDTERGREMEGGGSG